MTTLFDRLKRRRTVTDKWYGGVGRVVKKLSKNRMVINFTGASSDIINGEGVWDRAHVNKFLEEA